jgi:hypothetical protein
MMLARTAFGMNKGRFDHVQKRTGWLATRIQEMSHKLKLLAMGPLCRLEVRAHLQTGLQYFQLILKLLSKKRE